MRRFLTIISLATTLAVSAHVAVAQMSSQTAPGANLSAYRTYEWLATAPPPGANPIIIQQILADFDGAMTARGYQRVETGGDLTLALTVGAQQKTDVQSFGRFGLQTNVYQYTQGQLSLDIFDSKTNQALWHGQVAKTIDPNKPNQKKISQAIAKLMAQYPGTAAPAPAQ